MVTAAGFAAIFVLFGAAIIDVLTGVAEVRAAARAVLPWMMVAPLVSVWSYQLDGIFIGAVRSAEMRNAMVVALAIFVAAVTVLKPVMGNHGLWLAFLIFMTARLATLGAYYPRIERALREQR